MRSVPRETIVETWTTVVAHIVENVYELPVRVQLTGKVNMNQSVLGAANDVLVAIDYFTTWFEACKVVAPELEEL